MSAHRCVLARHGEDVGSRDRRSRRLPRIRRASFRERNPRTRHRLDGADRRAAPQIAPRPLFEAHGVSRIATTDPLTHRADLSVPEQTVSLLAHVNPSVVVHLAGGRERRSGTALRRATSRPRRTCWRRRPVWSRRPRSSQLDRQPSTASPPTASRPNRLLPTLSQTTDAPSSPLRLWLGNSQRRQAYDSASFARSTSCRRGSRLRLLSATCASNSWRRTGRHRVVRCGRLDVVRDFVPLHFVVEVLLQTARSRGMARAFSTCAPEPESNWGACSARWQTVSTSTCT